ncbi:hypothetical protein [Mucilaginibacter sp.]|jgi:hypothetical protein|uniref:hypothetical protein n=1 Tax=Mucilaginibacter sp. TaxID=1882438 RepID=UPI0035675C46
MKKKTLNYILIVVAAGVWALIGHRIFAGLAPQEPTLPARQGPGQLKAPADDYALTRDTTRLKLNYRDPFSSKKAPDTSMTKPGRIALSAPRPQTAADWTAIHYSGYMRNPGSKKLIALLRVNGRNLMLAEGEQAEKVKLIKNLRDSVKVSYQGSTRFIRMN